MDERISAAVDMALSEDMGPEMTDLTSLAIVGGEQGRAEIIANEPGILAGSAISRAVFGRLDPNAQYRALIKDGSEFSAGTIVADVEGGLKAILSAERTALNFLAHLSGIATLTRKFVKAVEGTEARIYDTRKTLPGLRWLEKAAVVAGGGRNHRFGLFDGVLIKDNHLYGRPLGEAVRAAGRAYPDKAIEVEVEELGQLKEALVAGADVVLLDNMDVTALREAIVMAKGKAAIEVSGGLTLNTVGPAARSGAERISVGAITQKAPPIDFSLEVRGTG